MFEVESEERRFTIEGDRLVFAEPAPREWVAYPLHDPPASVTGFVCTPEPE